VNESVVTTALFTCAQAARLENFISLAQLK